MISIAFEREIGQARALRLLGHQPGQPLERRDLARELGIERRRDAADLGGDGAHLLRDDREAAPRLAGALGLDHRVERENADAAGDLADLVDLVVGDAAHLAGEADDVAERDGVVLVRDLLSCGHDVSSPDWTAAENRQNWFQLN